MRNARPSSVIKVSYTYHSSSQLPGSAIAFPAHGPIEGDGSVPVVAGQTLPTGHHRTWSCRTMSTPGTPFRHLDRSVPAAAPFRRRSEGNTGGQESRGLLEHWNTGGCLEQILGLGCQLPRCPAISQTANAPINPSRAELCRRHALIAKSETRTCEQRNFRVCIGSSTRPDFLQRVFQCGFPRPSPMAGDHFR